MRKIFISILLTIPLVSCDHFNNTRVCNQTEKEITLKITFDPDVINTWSGGALAKNITKTFRNWDDNLIPINIDTISYISTYAIRPDSCGQIEGGNNRRPNFHFYKEIEIISEADTLLLQTKEEMIIAFDANRDDTKLYFDLLVNKNGKYSSR